VQNVAKCDAEKFHISLKPIVHSRNIVLFEANGKWQVVNLSSLFFIKNVGPFTELNVGTLPEVFYGANDILCHSKG